MQASSWSPRYQQQSPRHRSRDICLNPRQSRLRTSPVVRSGISSLAVAFEHARSPYNESQVARMLYCQAESPRESVSGRSSKLEPRAAAPGSSHEAFNTLCTLCACTPALPSRVQKSAHRHVPCGVNSPAKFSPSLAPKRAAFVRNVCSVASVILTPRCYRRSRTPSSSA